jgi:hypothetical protein
MVYLRCFISAKILQIWKHRILAWQNSLSFWFLIYKKYALQSVYMFTTYLHTKYVIYAYNYSLITSINKWNTDFTFLYNDDK